MAYLTVDGLRLYYEEYGDGTPLIMLHGGTGMLDADSGWGRLHPLLAERYRIILIEHRGHGRTNNPAGHLDYGLLLADLRAFIAARDLPRAHIAGMSDGGIVALALGMAHPELALSLICVGANYCVDERVAAALRGVTPERLPQDNPVWAASLEAQHDPHHAPGYWRTLVRQVIAAALSGPNWTTADLARIPLPTLLIAGDDDPIGHLGQQVAMRRAIPRAELLIVNHAPHIVQHTHHRIVGAAMLDFLARQERA